MESRISELLKDPSFIQKLFEIEEPEEVQRLFEENGEEISLDEIKALGRAVSTTVMRGGELNDDELEEVAGGMHISNPGAGWANAKEISRMATKFIRKGLLIMARKW